VRADDVVIVHDPQTAGLVHELRRLGAMVVWRCDVGVDRPNELTLTAWDFLRPCVGEAEALIFSRQAYVWDGLEPERVVEIAPSIDAFSAKNQVLLDGAVGGILHAAGVLVRERPSPPRFTDPADGSVRSVRRRATVIESAPCPADVPLVTQISRWDALKDPVGVLRAFSELTDETPAHLFLAGPDPSAISDDPEQGTVFDEVSRTWRELPAASRERCHLILLPMEDLEENAVIVNALQRRADVVVQKSLAEGFGLTVAEAMWKSRPTIASRVGGIQDQIEHERSGLLLDDPTDLSAFGDTLSRLLGDGDAALRMGREAHRRVRDRYLAPRELGQLGELLARLDQGFRSRRSG
jgi:trehalose synthase